MRAALVLLLLAGCAAPPPKAQHIPCNERPRGYCAITDPLEWG